MLNGADVHALIDPGSRIQPLAPNRVMWRATTGLLKHQRRFTLAASPSQGYHYHNPTRRTASAPLFGWDAHAPCHDFAGDGGMHLTRNDGGINLTRNVDTHLRSLRAKSHGELSSTSPLEQSLSTLHDALNRVVHPFLQVLPLPLDGTVTGGAWSDQRWGYQLKAVATAAEKVETQAEHEEEEAAAAAVMEPDYELEEQQADSTAPFRTPEMTAKESRHAKARARRLMDRERKLELDAWDGAVKEYRRLLAEMCRKKLAPNLPATKALMVSWFEPLRDMIAAELKAIDECDRSDIDRPYYGPYFQAAELDADVLAVITMHKVMALMMHDLESGCLRVGTAAIALGDAIEQEARLRRALSKPKKKTSDEEDPIDKKRAFIQKRLKSNKLHSWQLKKYLSALDQTQSWPTEAQARVGCRLIEMLVGVAHIYAPVSDDPEDGTELRPAFSHVLKVPTQKSIQQSFGAIICDSHLINEIESSARFVVMPYMPMLVPPRPWKGYSNGAYLNLRSAVMRTHGSKQQREAVRNTPKAQLHRVFRALDSLGQTAWKINGEILDVLEHLWKEGGGVAGLVDRKNAPLPPRPDTTDPMVIRNWREEYYALKRHNNQCHSQRCDMELKLSVARKFRDEEGFYFPHNLDFRGRAYPMHVHLNHLGSDACRGMLCFGKGRPLGESGLDWLKIHLANLFGNGVDKLPFKGRIQFADEHVESVMDSAENPLHGERWWMKAEDPFQCLATCMDIRRALLSPDPKKYVSYLPIHQDGSCNGLQHYAALGRDKNGARAVNLLPGEKPADVYSDIAARVRAIVEADAQKDPATYPNAACAKLLTGHIDRKLVKQTVMTSVYGVTYIGARQQIMNRLKNKSLSLDEALVYRSGCYAAKMTLEALGEMFKEARCIMNWLGDCAKVIASDGEAVRWVTPLGLPVVQPYRKPGKHVVKTTFQALVLRTDSDQPVMAKRQKTAFPPNFVHSMDGSHMMMTAVACHEAGLSFAGVHDSFWTHAADMDRLNKTLRDAFVELYSQPILENLLESFKEKFPKLKFPPLPDRGDLDLEKVRESQYFFS